MTETNTEPQSDPNEITLPPEVSALLDEASIPGGPYSARPTASSVQLVDKSGAVIKEVAWPDAGKWAANVLSNIAAMAQGGNDEETA